MLINTEQLLETLYDKFPDRVPDKVRDMRELGIKIGEQTVMKYIEYYVEQKQHESERTVKKQSK